MPFHPPRTEGVGEREFEIYKDVVTGAYRFHDMMLERLLQLAPSIGTQLGRAFEWEALERRQEADAAVRFRLRKSLPFDIEKAALSFDAQKTPKGLHVAASIVLHSVLEEYESAFRAAGCSPGVVLPSSLGALGAVNEPRPSLMLKVGQETTAVAVVSYGQLLLFRTLEGSGTGSVTAELMAEDIYPSLVYFQDSYGMSVEQLLVSGVSRLGDFAAALEEQTGVMVKELIGSGVVDGNLRNDFAGAVGALL